MSKTGTSDSYDFFTRTWDEPEREQSTPEKFRSRRNFEDQESKSGNTIGDQTNKTRREQAVVSIHKNSASGDESDSSSGNSRTSRSRSQSRYSEEQVQGKSSLLSIFKDGGGIMKQRGTDNTNKPSGGAQRKKRKSGNVSTDTESFGDEGDSRDPDGINDKDEEDEESSEIESQIEGSKTTSALLLAEESSQLQLQGISDGSLWNVLVFGEPVQRTQAEWDDWANLTFVPSSDPVSLSDKLPEDADPRFPEEEGLFVGHPLSIGNKNLNRLERRLLKENALGWFGQDGQLFSFPDPYRPERIQLFRDEIKEEEFAKNIVYVPAKLDPFQEFQLDPKVSYEIIADVGSLNFTHHPLFSKEHVMASRLDTAFQEYSRRLEMKTSERAENKLKALREAVIHGKSACETAESSLDKNSLEDEEEKKTKDNIFQLKDRIQRYRSEMRKTRLERDQSLWDDRAAIAAVLDTWKALKAIRQDQGFTNTLLKLNIITLQEDYHSEKTIWQEEMEQECQDLKEEYEEEYILNLARYRAKMKEWSEMKRQEKIKGKVESDRKKKQKEIKARKRSVESDKRGDDESNSGSGSDNSEVSLSRKPIPPAKFDAEKTKSAIEKRFREVKKQPGEPKIVLELLRSMTITAKAQLPPGTSKEEQRRKITHRTKIELRILFNGKLVYRSKPKDLSPEFSAFFGLTVPIIVNEWPESIIIEILETGGISKNIISEIDLALPNSKTSIDRCHMQKMEFYSDKVVKTGHAGVGCGTEYEILGTEIETLYTSGFATVRVGWSTDKDGNVLCPKGFENLHETEDADNFNLTSKQIFRNENVQKWTENAQVDPNDPQNARWLNMVIKNISHPQTKKSSKSPKLGDGDATQDFTLDKLMSEFDFCSMESIENSLRYRILQLRDDEVPEFKGLKMIPTFEKDVPLDAFEAYERRLKEDMRKRLGEPTLGKTGRKRLLDEDSIYESNRLEKIREMRLSVLQLFENSLKHITFEDIVVEEQIPDIGTLGLNLMTLFQPRRPLKPTRKERKRIQGSTLIDTKISLIVNIVRAFNLPMRKDTEVGLLTTESVTGVPLIKKRIDRNTGNYSTVKPFVEVWFQRNVCRTTTALGSNPTWNQELQLNLAVPNDDYSPSNLSRMDDFVYLLVYDEVAIDLLEDDRRRDTDIHQRLEKRWLGSITIPFSTLFTNGRIEGTFKLNSPPILLGYEAQGMATHFGQPTNPGRGHISSTNLFGRQSQQSSFPFSNQKNAFITLFITLQPGVNPSNISKEDSATGETPDMMSHVRSWKNSFQRKFSDRFIKPFVMTPDGDTVLCTRFLKPIEPPESLLISESELIKTMEDLAHYVSLFPSVRDSTLGITDYSLWFTSDVFVMSPGGGIEDHAVLLACFFLHLNVPCWIIQGNAIPDGPTTFVATTFKGISEEKSIAKSLKNAVLIWNPCNGEYYNANDNFCPLQKVWAAIGKLNMWANVYEGERPHQLDWDIGKSKQWMPLFPKTVAESKIPSVQPGTLNYKTPDQIQANSLAQRIERHLKEAFMKWRKTSKTNWNRYCSATLRRLLPKLEETKSGRSRAHDSGTAESTLTIQSSSPPSINDEHLLELREVMTSYQITGFPLQQPYVNMESITETVYATGVHTIDTPDVEFAVAAYAQAYPASVYSVWIYVAALHRRK